MMNVELRYHHLCILCTYILFSLGQSAFTYYTGYHCPPRPSDGRWYSIGLNDEWITNTSSSSSYRTADPLSFGLKRTRHYRVLTLPSAASSSNYVCVGSTFVVTEVV